METLQVDQKKVEILRLKTKDRLIPQPSSYFLALPHQFLGGYHRTWGICF